MYRLLHCADIHLETSFASMNLPPAIGSRRRTALRGTLGRILALAREREVDAVTIGGDLYEQKYASTGTAEFLVQQFARLAPIRVFITPGVHHPHTNDSLYVCTNWPSNVTVFSRGHLTAEKLAPKLHLWGAAHPPERSRRDLKGFKVSHEGIDVLLLHAVDGDQAAHCEDGSFVIHSTSILDSGLDFACLGGNHDGYSWPEPDPFCLYPGSVEALAVAEAGGNHDAVLLTVQDDATCTTERIPVGRWRYTSVEVDLTECETFRDAVGKIRQALSESGRPDDTHMISSVMLTGEPDLDLDLTALAEEVQNEGYVRIGSCFSLSHDLERLAQERTVRGTLARRFRESMSSPSDDRDRRIALNALHLALRALDGREVHFHEVE